MSIDNTGNPDGMQTGPDAAAAPRPGPGAGVTAAEGLRWIAAIPGDTTAQRRILTQLVEAAGDSPRLRWIEMTGSLARGAGDALSDIDAGMGIADAEWDATDDGAAAVAATETILHGFGPVADSFRQRFAGKDDATCWHLVTLYESGVQLSLVIMPASWRQGLPPLSVALYDADAILARPYLPPSARATAQDAREWACLGWMALGDVAKYAERGSAWEARARLEEARGMLWQLWAIALESTYPAFGLTSVLDTPGAHLPAGIETTAAGLAVADVLTAAAALAGLLDAVSEQARRQIAFEPPDRLRDWVRSRLAHVAGAPSGSGQ
jgi:hypothetical protein